MAPAVSPSINCFEAIKNNRIIGNDANVSPAKSEPQSAECSPNNDIIPTGIVRFIFSVIKISGKKKSFHAAIKLIITTVPSAGRINGNTTYQRTLRFPVPSIRAASSNSEGIVLKKPVSMSMDKGIPVAVFIKIKDHKELISPKSRIKIKRGTIPNFIGIIMPNKNIKNKAWFHENLKRAI